ncbi:MAG: radical SAM protein, partial [Moorea sp. SIO3G5]|nr:radical SAM protein [Moorena sp. SIO3G5]
VGGSDAIGRPDVYLKAGATAIVKDKSGAANWSIFDHVLGQPEREPLSGVLFADGTEYRKQSRSSNPEIWPIPSLDVVKQCLGHKENYSASALAPHGSVFVDLGCDRTCDFCMTPTYRLGYQRMSPQRALEWFAVQKEAGALGVQSHSDQFLGRVLFPEGRQELLEILNQLREMEIPVSWPNGLELKKATLGRGIRPDGDMTPDEELIKAIWGWDGKVGCFYAFIPAERPLSGRESYKKLMPWQQHCEVMRAIVRSGVPRIGYAVIIGLPDDSHEDLLFLEEGISQLYRELKEINPSLEFYVRGYSIMPFPGTLQEKHIRQAGLLVFDDPVIIGGFWVTCANTHHLSYLEVWEWQKRLMDIGDEPSRGHWFGHKYRQ